MAEPIGRTRTWLLIALAHDTFWLEVVLAGASLAWALAMWWMPGDLADRRAYAAAARFAPDELWCVMGAIGGAIQVAAAVRHSRVPRFLAAVAMALFWLVLADGVAASVPGFTPSLIPFYCLAAFSALCAAVPLVRRLPWLRA